YVEKIQEYSCQIFDTRKTLPVLRALEKYAVRVGGGSNHRSSLDERFVIKQNHLKFIKKDNPMQAAVLQAKAYKPNVPIEIDVSDFSMLKQAM
ncbi:nicotinate-nucleotide diphosphorylase (carboxylating), partial [Acinetobacter baumannii]